MANRGTKGLFAIRQHGKFVRDRARIILMSIRNSFINAIILLIIETILPDKAMTASAPRSPQCILQIIGLKCPVENNSILERLTQNPGGTTQRVRIQYQDGVPHMVNVDVIGPGMSDWAEFTKGNPDNHNEYEYDYLNNLRQILDVLYHRICTGNLGERDAFEKVLESNRRKLREIANRPGFDPTCGH